ncbi:hypothetical protein NL676_008923 [Syzygium grande]|nr:hypothetical protein NL676_008923 [Syzygium grande]
MVLGKQGVFSLAAATSIIIDRKVESRCHIDVYGYTGIGKREKAGDAVRGMGSENTPVEGEDRLSAKGRRTG